MVRVQLLGSRALQMVGGRPGAQKYCTLPSLQNFLLWGWMSVPVLLYSVHSHHILLRKERRTWRLLGSGDYPIFPRSRLFSRDEKKHRLYLKPGEADSETSGC